MQIYPVRSSIFLSKYANIPSQLQETSRKNMPLNLQSSLTLAYTEQKRTRKRILMSFMPTVSSLSRLVLWCVLRLEAQGEVFPTKH